MPIPPHIIARNREEQTQPSVFETRKLMATAATMRKDGHSYPHIAQTLGCSRSYAEKLVRKALREIIEEPVAELMKLELGRLDQLFIPAFAEATKLDRNGEPIFNKEAIETVIKIMERRARFLGLDKPVKSEVNANINNNDTSVQIYMPHNGRDLPKGLLIENGEIVQEEMKVVEEEINLDIDSGDDDDLSELYE
jgi:hypothetical protein